MGEKHRKIDPQPDHQVGPWHGSLSWFFLKKLLPPIVYVPNDQRFMGIMLTYVCWGTHRHLPPPPPEPQKGPGFEQAAPPWDEPTCWGFGGPVPFHTMPPPPPLPPPVQATVPRGRFAAKYPWPCAVHSGFFVGGVTVICPKASPAPKALKKKFPPVTL